MRRDYSSGGFYINPRICTVPDSEYWQEETRMPFMANIFFRFVFYFCRWKVVIRKVRSDMNFGPVVKPLGITVKREVEKVVETSDVVRSQDTREYLKRGQEPPEPKNDTQKGGPKNF